MAKIKNFWSYVILTTLGEIFIIGGAIELALTKEIGGLVVLFILLGVILRVVAEEYR